jgi:hypothetical protein
MMYAYFDALYHNGALFTATQMFDAMTIIALASTGLVVALLRDAAKRGHA